MISTLLRLKVLVLSIGINDSSNASYNVVTSTLWIVNESFYVADSLNLPLRSTAVSKTLLFITACNMDKNTSTSVFNYVVSLSDLSDNVISVTNIVS